MAAITTEKILPVSPPSPRIFVFGSNLAGHHGKGAALYAKIHYGAQTGIAIGHIGQCYAIPTKDHYLRSLDLETVAHHVRGFIAYARDKQDLEFNVTQVGCGLAGNKSQDIAPMFGAAPMNCHFDPAWRPFFNIPRNYWEPGTL